MGNRSRVHENRDFRLKVWRIAPVIAWRDQVQSCQDSHSREGESGYVQITGRLASLVYPTPELIVSHFSRMTYGFVLPAWTYRTGPKTIAT